MLISSHLSSLVINGVTSFTQVIWLLDVRENTPTNAHHPQKLVNIITGIPDKQQQLNQPRNVQVALRQVVRCAKASCSMMTTVDADRNYAYAVCEGEKCMIADPTLYSKSELSGGTNAPPCTPFPVCFTLVRLSGMSSPRVCVCLL